MKDGPDIAFLASLIGDPARANMLTAMMSGMAFTATELAGEASVTLQTASAHLRKLEEGGLIVQRKQGRHRYFSLADDGVGQTLENLMGLAAAKGHLRTRTGPKDPALRKARVCYDHLAGELGVAMLDAFKGRGLVAETPDDLVLTPQGRTFLQGCGLDVSALEGLRRPLCKSCLDWSMRRSHLAGALGKAVLDRVYDEGWAHRLNGSRIVAFTKQGEAAFRQTFCPSG